MNRYLRALLAPLTIALSLASIAVACPQWTEKVGLDVWTCFEHEQNLRHDQQRFAELDERGARVYQRVSLKVQVSHQLVEGRLSLAEATDEFLDLNRLEPAIADDTRRRFAGDSEEESAALQVISFVRSELGRDSARCREMAWFMEEQLEEIRGSNRSAPQ